MNLFEVLGLPKDYREKNKVTMKVCHFDEVPDSKKPRTGVYLGQIKKDGIFCHVLKYGGTYQFFSRTGMRLMNTEYLDLILSLYGDDRMLDGVYMAELCCEYCSLEELSGIFNPNRIKALSSEQKTHCRNSQLFFFDYVSIKEFIAGKSDTDYGTRYGYMQGMIPMHFNLLDTDLLHIDDIAAYAAKIIESGEEGVVIKRACEYWEAGHKGYKQMKIVKGVDYDLLCVDVEEGTGKYEGKVANLIFAWKEDRSIKAMLGKGWTHKGAEDMFNNYMCSQDDSPIGKIFHVHALQESSKGVLRLPKVCEMRIDKEETDV